MAKQYDKIEVDHRAFIEAQHIFFTGTAAPEGRVNVSPKGMDSLRVLGPNRIIWLNWTGSGNETAGHLKLANRITLMWCGFEKRPMILRIYGSARMILDGDPEWDRMLAHFGPAIGARQIYDVSVEMVQTSCGYAVPHMDFAGERDTLKSWSDKQGRDAIQSFWSSRNTRTIDGEDTGFDDA